MKTLLVQRSCATALVLALLPFIANAQFRLDQFTNSDPSKSALQLTNGSLVWAMALEDTTFLWCGNDAGVAQWARSITEPGYTLQLVEGANFSTLMIEEYNPITEEVLPDEFVVTQRLRITRISEQGAVEWSEQCEYSFPQPFDFAAYQVFTRAIPTSDGGLLVSVAHATTLSSAIVHLLRLTENGEVSWSERVGSTVTGGDLVLIYGTPSFNGLFLTEYTEGRFVMALDEAGWDTQLHMFGPDGEQLLSRTLNYTGASIYARLSSLTTTAAGHLLVGGRMSTMPSANIVAYRLDEDLEFVDGDIYWGFGTTSSSELQAIACRADGDRVLEVVSAGGDESFTYFLEVNEDGDIINPARSIPLPYVDDQTITVKPKHFRYDDAGVRLAHTLSITHPILGNLGHFSERSLIDPSSPDCYFALNPVGHVDVPDSLVSMESLPSLIVADAITTISSASPLSPHSLIGTTSGCQLQIGMAELGATTGFTLASNALSQGMSLQVNTEGPLELCVFDARGRMILNGERLPGAGQWSVSLPTLGAGVYCVIARSGPGALAGVRRFVVQ